MLANGHWSTSHHILAGKGEGPEAKGTCHRGLPFILEIIEVLHSRTYSCFIRKNNALYSSISERVGV